MDYMFTDDPTGLVSIIKGFLGQHEFFIKLWSGPLAWLTYLLGFIGFVILILSFTWRHLSGKNALAWVVLAVIMFTGPVSETLFFDRLDVPGLKYVNSPAPAQGLGTTDELEAIKDKLPDTVPTVLERLEAEGADTRSPVYIHTPQAAVLDAGTRIRNSIAGALSEGASKHLARDVAIAQALENAATHDYRPHYMIAQYETACGQKVPQSIPALGGGMKQVNTFSPGLETRMMKTFFTFGDVYQLTQLYGTTIKDHPIAPIHAAMGEPIERLNEMRGANRGPGQTGLSMYDEEAISAIQRGIQHWMAFNEQGEAFRVQALRYDSPYTLGVVRTGETPKVDMNEFTDDMELSPLLNMSNVNRERLLSTPVRLKLPIVEVNNKGVNVITGHHTVENCHDFFRLVRDSFNTAQDDMDKLDQEVAQLIRDGNISADDSPETIARVAATALQQRGDAETLAALEAHLIAARINNSPAFQGAIDRVLQREGNFSGGASELSFTGGQVTAPILRWWQGFVAGWNAGSFSEMFPYLIGLFTSYAIYLTPLVYLFGLAIPGFAFNALIIPTMFIGYLKLVEISFTVVSAFGKEYSAFFNASARDASTAAALNDIMLSSAYAAAFTIPLAVFLFMRKPSAALEATAKAGQQAATVSFEEVRGMITAAIGAGAAVVSGGSTALAAGTAAKNFLGNGGGDGTPGGGNPSPTGGGGGSGTGGGAAEMPITDKPQQRVDPANWLPAPAIITPPPGHHAILDSQRKLGFAGKGRTQRAAREAEWVEVPATEPQPPHDPATAASRARWQRDKENSPWFRAQGKLSGAQLEKAKKSYSKFKEENPEKAQYFRDLETYVDHVRKAEARRLARENRHTKKNDGGAE